MELEKMYEQYKKEREEVKVQVAVYESRVEESIVKLRELLDSIDNDEIGELTGKKLIIDLERVNDRNYLSEVIKESREIKDILTREGLRMINTGRGE